MKVEFFLLSFVVSLDFKRQKFESILTFYHWTLMFKVRWSSRKKSCSKFRPISIFKVTNINGESNFSNNVWIVKIARKILAFYHLDSNVQSWTRKIVQQVLSNFNFQNDKCDCENNFSPFSDDIWFIKVARKNILLFNSNVQNSREKKSHVKFWAISSFKKILEIQYFSIFY